MDFHRIFDILPYQKIRFPNKLALASKQDGQWKGYSTDACIEEINQVSAGLIQMGLKRGDKMGMMCYIGSPEWCFLDLGMQQIGVIPVPIHATVQPDELVHILKDAALEYCIVGESTLLEKVKAVHDQAPQLTQLYTIQKVEGISHWSSIKTPVTQKYISEIENRKNQIKEDDLATIIYTSGTTGKPKGVMLSHKNIVSNIKSTIPLSPLNHTKVTMSFLPISHIFERMVTYLYMSVGASIYFAERVDKAVDNLQEVHPHFFTAVPRLLERVYDSILDSAKEKGGITKRAVYWAINLGKKHQEYSRLGFMDWLQYRIASIFVYRYWRKALGGKVEGVTVGAAALRPELGRLFSAAGVNIREGYGLTETSPVIAFNRFEPGGYRFGTVGIPIPGMEIKIKDADEESGEGEIVVRGPNVMMGYYQLPEETEKVIDKDGWFHTGDVGKIVYRHFLQITDRKKDIFKTTSGKYVAPQFLENQLKSSIYINQVMIVGFNRPFVTALIIPNFFALKRWCTDNNVHWTAPQFMVINPKVEEFFNSLITNINKGFNKHEQIHKHHLLFNEWTPESAEFTPTLKLRRDFILRKYEKEIEKMYG